MSRTMNDQKTTTLTVPGEVKRKFDSVYEQSRAASSEARWLTLNKAIEALAEKHGYSVDLKVESNDQKQTNQVRR